MVCSVSCLLNRRGVRPNPPPNPLTFVFRPHVRRIRHFIPLQSLFQRHVPQSTRHRRHRGHHEGGDSPGGDSSNDDNAAANDGADNDDDDYDNARDALSGGVKPYPRRVDAEGLVVVLQVVLTSLRNVRLPGNQVIALNLMVRRACVHSRARVHGGRQL
jgi:hypothetical protein